MATNKNALIRYKTIDKCLQNRSRRWTLDDLIDACSDALYEFEGKESLVSKRTVQLDIQHMRSDKLGYEAPIICYERKYYTYADENYSITNLPISQLDLDVLSESMMMLSQFKDFSLFQELNGLIQKLEDKVYRESKSEASIIHMEKNEHLLGLEYLDLLYQAILKKIVLRIRYKSFAARRDSELVFHPYILKEYNNRWFLVGREAEQDKILTLALDRIFQVDMDLQVDYDNRGFSADDYYRDTIGVTVLGEKQLLEIVFRADRRNAPYILTKPFHASQELLERHRDGSMTFRMRVHHNFELERLLLGFGEGLTVLAPKKLIKRMKSKLYQALQNYAPPEQDS